MLSIYQVSTGFFYLSGNYWLYLSIMKLLVISIYQEITSYIYLSGNYWLYLSIRTALVLYIGTVLFSSIYRDSAARSILIFLNQCWRFRTVYSINLVYLIVWCLKHSSVCPPFLYSPFTEQKMLKRKIHENLAHFCPFFPS